MAQHNYHGGSCCGIGHISRMHVIQRPNGSTINGSEATIEQWDEHLRTLLRRFLTPGNRNRCAEITLTDGQCRSMPNLLLAMGALGFKPVTRFRNSNSGNLMTIFHRIEQPAGDAFPFRMGDAGVHTERFVRVYESGRQSRQYATRAEAETYKGRAIVNRIDVVSSNSSRLFG